MKVAVTGATGFVGSHLAEALRARGHEVVCLVRSPDRAASLAAAGCRLLKGALDDEAALKTFVEGAEIVQHVAGAVTAVGGGDGQFERVNREGTVRLAGLARTAGVRRFVYVSSLAASGPAPRGTPLPDANGSGPVTPYGRSKLAGEEAVRASNVRFTIIRPPAVYGPRDRNQFLPAFKLARRGFHPVIGDGLQELSLIHVRDLAEALIAAGESTHAEGRAYHAAHPQVVTQRELFSAVGRSVGRARVTLVPVPKPVMTALLHIVGTAADVFKSGTVLRPNKAPELFAPAWTCSSAPLLADAGWSARIGLDEGLAETARWYREAGWL
jgi:nucleoside-diphosphate-sugar epimerase